MHEYVPRTKRSARSLIDGVYAAGAAFLSGLLAITGARIAKVANSNAATHRSPSTTTQNGGAPDFGGVPGADQNGRGVSGCSAGSSTGQGGRSTVPAENQPPVGRSNESWA